MTMFNTLLLDVESWDLTMDSAGNIAMTTPAYALAQDIASAVRLFLGELYYDSSKGIPYFEQVLGQLPPPSLITSLIENAAMTVPGVVSAQCIISTFDNRTVTGRIQFMDESGETNVISF